MCALAWYGVNIRERCELLIVLLFVKTVLAVTVGRNRSGRECVFEPICW